jgi:tRNA G18 (ribose-2'-O)-methylase SpoU
MTRGYFGIGVWHIKHRCNIGTLIRSADLLGAAFVFTIGRRYQKQNSDTYKSWRHMPLWHFDTIADLVAASPYSAPIVGVELTDNAHPIETFFHPTRAVYLLGAEDHGLSPDILARCHAVVRLPGPRSMNVASAGTVVMYDRYLKTASARAVAV